MNCLFFYSGHFSISGVLLFCKSVYTLKLSIHFVCVCVAHYLICHSCNLGDSYINYEFDKIKSKLIYSYNAIEKVGINASLLLYKDLTGHNPKGIVAENL